MENLIKLSNIEYGNVKIWKWSFSSEWEIQFELDSPGLAIKVTRKNADLNLAIESLYDEVIRLSENGTKQLEIKQLDAPTGQVDQL